MSDISGVAVSSVRLSPNPISTGASYLVSVGVRTITAKGYTLSASSWSGTGPYTQTIAVDSSITVNAECMVYGDHTMTVEQRMAEYNAFLRSEVTATGRITVTALGERPDRDIPVRVVVGGLPVSKSVSVPVSSWSGSGPWTAEVGVGRTVGTALCGPVSGSSDDSALQVMDCGIHVSKVSGATVTLRAMLAKPTSALTVGVMAL